MIIKRVLLLAAALVACAAFTVYARTEVTTGSLLREMTDRDALARFPELEYQCLQASSYDRHSVSKDQPGWFANLDRNWWVRIERDRGRREFVMMDAEGPGAVTRFWMTTYEDVLKGIVRIYLDGSDTPAVEGPMIDLLGSDALAPYPLAAGVPGNNPPRRRGHNLYLPIPFAKSCKITFEGDTVNENDPGAGKSKVGKVYYNIEYRKYPAGTAVRTFSRADMEVFSGEIAAACRSLLEKPAGASGSMSLDCTLPAGKSRSFTLKGAKAVRQLSMKVQAADMKKALRSLVVEFAFNGRKTVSVPAGDFFGVGTEAADYSTMMARSEDGWMCAYWTMPFRKKCRLTLRNLSDAEISLSGAELGYGPWEWDSRSMYFHASWAEEEYPVGTQDACYDINFVSLKGQGVYAGTEVSILNGAKKWWGEGDEKVYVDGETFPSHFGTGSEDHFGYAWSSPTEFSHPFIAQPNGKGANRPGFVSNVRWRMLDAIPFRKSLVFDMELLQVTNPGTVTYGRTNYWYMLP